MTLQPLRPELSGRDAPDLGRFQWDDARHLAEDAKRCGGSLLARRKTVQSGPVTSRQSP